MLATLNALQSGQKLVCVVALAVMQHDPASITHIPTNPVTIWAPVFTVFSTHSKSATAKLVFSFAGM